MGSANKQSSHVFYFWVFQNSMSQKQKMIRSGKFGPAFHGPTLISLVLQDILKSVAKIEEVRFSSVDEI